MFDHPHDVLELFRVLEERMEYRDVPGRPEELKDFPHAAAYYGAFQLALGEVLSTEPNVLVEYVELAKHIDAVVNDLVAQYSVNSANLESAIRKSLLPTLFKRFGMDRAMIVLDHVIQIVRVGLLG
jgi:type I restriction enzyme, R subunit